MRASSTRINSRMPSSVGATLSGVRSPSSRGETWRSKAQGGSPRESGERVHGLGLSFVPDRQRAVDLDAQAEVDHLVEILDQTHETAGDARLPIVRGGGGAVQRNLHHERIDFIA
jgi:hypothetical protein